MSVRPKRSRNMIVREAARCYRCLLTHFSHSLLSSPWERPVWGGLQPLALGSDLHRTPLHASAHATELHAMQAYFQQARRRRGLSLTQLAAVPLSVAPSHIVSAFLACNAHCNSIRSARKKIFPNHQVFCISVQFIYTPFSIFRSRYR